MSDFIELTKEYGLAASIGLLATGLGGRALWIQNRLSLRVDLIEDDLETVHDRCNISPESISGMQESIDQLKLENARFDALLETFKESVDKMDSKLDRLIDFHMEKR